MDAVLIEREALGLPESERALLADRLLGSLESKRPTFEKEWLDVSRERFDAYKAGQMAASDGKSAVSAIRSDLRK